MPVARSVFRGRLVRWSVVAASFWSAGAASVATAQQREEFPGKVPPWPCRLIPATTIRPVIEKALNRSETIRLQCAELAAAGAVIALEWGAMDSQSHAKSRMVVRDGVVVATVKLPPLGDIIVLMAHELQHVIELTRGLDFAAEADRTGSGVWLTRGGYETQAAIDVSHQVAEELRTYSKAGRL